MANEKESLPWFENFLFTKIFQTFRMAIQPSKLIIALLAVAVICLAGRVMDYIVAAAWKPQGEMPVLSTLWDSIVAGFDGVAYSLLVLDVSGVGTNATSLYKAVGQTIGGHYVYGVILFAMLLAVFSIAGGAICRIAALQFARGEKPGLTEALTFSTRRFFSLFAAPLTPVGIIIFIGLFIFVLGLIGNIPWVGELLMGICMPLTLLAGGLIAVVLIGAIGGFNLMFPAVAYDDSDCFDAISRSLSYVYAKPWRMGFYTVIAAVYGIICYGFVRLFTFLVLCVSRWSLQLGILGDNSKLDAIWPKPSFAQFFGGGSLTPANWTESTAAFLVHLFVLAMAGLVVSFVVSFYFSANTVIYSLMRNRVDRTAIEDVYTYSEETQPGPPAPEPEAAQAEAESEQQSSSPPSSQ